MKGKRTKDKFSNDSGTVLSVHVPHTTQLELEKANYVRSELLTWDAERRDNRSQTCWRGLRHLQTASAGSFLASPGGAKAID